MVINFDSFLGYWKREDTGAVYLFFARACVVILDGKEVVYKALVENTEGVGYLKLDSEQYEVTEMSEQVFVLMYNSSPIHFKRVPPPEGYAQ